MWMRKVTPFDTFLLSAQQMTLCTPISYEISASPDLEKEMESGFSSLVPQIHTMQGLAGFFTHLLGLLRCKKTAATVAKNS